MMSGDDFVGMVGVPARVQWQVAFLWDWTIKVDNILEQENQRSRWTHPQICETTPIARCLLV